MMWNEKDCESTAMQQYCKQDKIYELIQVSNFKIIAFSITDKNDMN